MKGESALGGAHINGRNRIGQYKNMRAVYRGFKRYVAVRQEASEPGIGTSRVTWLSDKKPAPRVQGTVCKLVL